MRYAPFSKKHQKEQQEMAKTHTYSMEKILAAREVLRQLPAKEKERSRAEVVEFLKADLRKAVHQGHSLKEIQAILAEQGISVSLARMEAVLEQAGKDSERKKTGKPRSENLADMPQAVQAGNERRDLRDENAGAQMGTAKMRTEDQA
jgi:hypothetical protein